MQRAVASVGHLVNVFSFGGVWRAGDRRRPCSSVAVPSWMEVLPREFVVHPCSGLWQGVGHRAVLGGAGAAFFGNYLRLPILIREGP